MAAKTLGELVSRKLTPASALAAAVEVKVETTVVSGEPGKYYLVLPRVTLCCVMCCIVCFVSQEQIIVCLNKV